MSVGPDGRAVLSPAEADLAIRLTLPTVGVAWEQCWVRADDAAFVVGSCQRAMEGWLAGPGEVETDDVLSFVAEGAEDHPWGSGLWRLCGAQVRRSLEPWCRRVLAVLDAAPALAWWQAGMAAQQWVMLGESGWSARDPGRDDAWWVLDDGPAVRQTTRGLSGRWRCVAESMEDPARVMPRSRRPYLVPPRYLGGRDVLEIRTAQDYVALLDRYGAPVAPASQRWRDWNVLAAGWEARGFDVGGRSDVWLAPDWAAVSRDWDGVHLSVHAWLRLAGRVIAVRSGRTMLCGWNPDVTVWLRAADWPR